MLWTVIALIFVFGLFYWLFEVSESLSLIFYGMCVILMSLSVLLMCMALYKIRQTVNNQMNEMMNMPRLVTHALAFILWIASTIIYTAIDLTVDLFYFNWMFITLIGSTSYFFLFLLVWHLGSKNPDQICFKANRNSRETNCSVVSVDFTAAETY